MSRALLKSLQNDSEFVHEMLQGEKLIQVCVGLGQVNLNFTNKLVISIGGKFVLCNGDERLEMQGENPIHTKELSRLLNESIQSYSFGTDTLKGDTLVLQFSNGHTLNLVKLIDGYESFSLTKVSTGFYI